MAIKHIKNIQAKAAAAAVATGATATTSNGVDGGEGRGGANTGAAVESSVSAAAAAVAARQQQRFQVDQYREGYQECLATAVQFLFEISAHFEEICMKMVSHLKEHFNDVVCIKGEEQQQQQQQQHQQHSSNGYYGKRRPPRDTDSPLSNLGELLLANGVGLTEARAAVAAGGIGGGMGPRLAHLCGSINGHSSNSSNGGKKNGNAAGGCGGGACEGVASSSDGQEVMNCAKDLSCRGAGANNKPTSNNNNNNHSNSSTTSSADNNNDTMMTVCNGGGGLEKDDGGNVVGCPRQRAPPQQTPVITSTASTAHTTTTDLLLMHAETESSSSAIDHHHHHHHHGCGGGLAVGNNNNNNIGGSCSSNGNNSGKVHNLTESSCDGVEHHYKYKNYMQQRFSHERYHDEHVVSNSSNELHDQEMVGATATAAAPSTAAAIVGALLARGPNMAAVAPPVEPTDSNCSVDTFVAFNAKRAAALATLEALKSGGVGRQMNEETAGTGMVIKEEKMDTSSSLSSGGSGVGGTCEVAPRMSEEGSQQMAAVAARMRVKGRLGTGTGMVPVPIFALHAHGAFYIPLTVDYEALVPYLGEVNLLDKSRAAVKALHPVNINIYAPF